MVFSDFLHELLVFIGALNRLAASRRHLEHAVLPPPLHKLLTGPVSNFMYPDTYKLATVELVGRKLLAIP